MKFSLISLVMELISHDITILFFDFQVLYFGLFFTWNGSLSWEIIFLPFTAHKKHNGLRPLRKIMVVKLVPNNGYDGSFNSTIVDNEKTLWVRVNSHCKTLFIYHNKILGFRFCVLIPY